MILLNNSFEGEKHMRSRTVKKGLVIVIIILFIGAGITQSTLANSKLKNEFNGNKSRGYIQDLINNASIGDTINIPSGTYYENIKINKTVNLVGAGKDTTTLMPSSIYRDIVEISADWVNLSGFTIRKAGESLYGVEILSDHNTVKDNNISENYHIGIGIFGSFNTIKDNEIYANDVEGIIIQDNSDNTIEGNIISYNPLGLNFLESTNNIVDDNTISNNEIGIELYYDSEINTISGNTINSNQEFGITLFGDNNILNGNTISNNNCGIKLESSNNDIISNSFLNDGIYVNSPFSNNILDNTVNGKSLAYLEVESNKIIDAGAGQIILVNCDSITIQDQEITDTYTGIILINSDNCLITNNNINSNNENGIDFYRSNYNDIKDNQISNNEIGIFLLNCENNNKISSNTITLNNLYGIVLSSSNNNIISGNEIESNNGFGISLVKSQENEIKSNNISDNTLGIGIFSTDTYGNDIYHNNFLNNDDSAHDSSDIGNNWDDGTYGNYWSDYRQKYPNAKKLRQQGIWDTPYQISGRDNKDNRPLIKQWPKSSSAKPVTKTTFNFILKWILDQFPILENMLLYLITG
jgi:parallel beta-helix repeat protein